MGAISMHKMAGSGYSAGPIALNAPVSRFLPPSRSIMPPVSASGAPSDRPHRLLVWHWGRRGGGPRYTLEMARALAARGDVELHLSYSRQSELAAEMDELARGLGRPGLVIDTYTGVVSAAAATLRLGGLRRRFAAYLAAHRIDTVFCTMGHVWNAAVSPVIRRAGAGYVLILHDARPHPGEESWVLEWLARRDVARAERVVVLSQHVRALAMARFGLPPERLVILPHAAMAFPGLRPAERQAPQGRPWRLVFFGRILAYKGFDLLLDTYARLRAQFGAGVELHVAGYGDTAPFAAQLAALPGVTLDNRWIAEDEIGPILNAADLLLLPYREASQSGVAPGAAMAGLPAVATPVGGLAEQVIDGRTGRIAASVDADALAAAAASLMTDAALYRRCSAGALQFARDTLSWEASAARVMEAATGLIGEKSVACQSAPPATRSR